MSLGFLDLRFYMSRLRSLVTRLPYKKNKRDANTITGYNTIIDSFLFISFLVLSRLISFLQQRKLPHAIYNVTFLGKEAKFFLISYSRMKQDNFGGIFPKRRLRA